jgi:hypothetical protein
MNNCKNRRYFTRNQSVTLCWTVFEQLFRVCKGPGICLSLPGVSVQQKRRAKKETELQSITQKKENRLSAPAKNGNAPLKQLPGSCL